MLNIFRYMQTFRRRTDKNARLWGALRSYILPGITTNAAFFC
jgi:hypothetical protein